MATIAPRKHLKTVKNVAVLAIPVAAPGQKYQKSAVTSQNFGEISPKYTSRLGVKSFFTLQKWPKKGRKNARCRIFWDAILATKFQAGARVGEMQAFVQCMAFLARFQPKNYFCPKFWRNIRRFAGIGPNKG